MGRFKNLFLQTLSFVFPDKLGSISVERCMSSVSPRSFFSLPVLELLLI